LKFPAPVKKINDLLALISGIIITIMAFLAAMEVILRRLHHPTSWSLNLSQYLLIWAILLVAASTFENKGHVSVDFIRTTFARRFGIIWARLLAVFGYSFCIVYTLVLGWQATGLFIEAVKLNKLTLGTLQIPVAYLYPAMIIGPILITLTLVCIILDLISGNKTYLSEEDF
jgi:TRAP-type C4-dicarboxylate transport system permease small subunit